LALLHVIACDHNPDDGPHCETKAWPSTVLAGYIQALRKEGWHIIPGTRQARCPRHNPNRRTDRRALITALTAAATTGSRK
jgi:hypothetical protein